MGRKRAREGGKPRLTSQERRERNSIIVKFQGVKVGLSLRGKKSRETARIFKEKDFLVGSKESQKETVGKRIEGASWSLGKKLQ